MAFTVRVKSILLPRSPVIKMGSATEVLAWLQRRGHPMGEELMLEAKNSAYYMGWRVMRGGDLNRMAEKEARS